MVSWPIYARHTYTTHGDALMPLCAFGVHAPPVPVDSTAIPEMAFYAMGTPCPIVASAQLDSAAFDSFSRKRYSAHASDACDKKQEKSARKRFRNPTQARLVC